MKVVTLRGLTENKFNEERDKLLSKGATSPPLFSTLENFIDSNLDKRIYVDMDTFLKKKRNGDFGQTFDVDGVLFGVSNYLFID